MRVTGPADLARVDYFIDNTENRRSDPIAILTFSSQPIIIHLVSISYMLLGIPKVDRNIIQMLFLQISSQNNPQQK